MMPTNLSSLMTKTARTRLSRMSCRATTTFSSGLTLMVTTDCGFYAKHVFTLFIRMPVENTVVGMNNLRMRLRLAQALSGS